MAAIIGTNGNDTLNGTSNPDTIIGRAGNDRLFGNGGNDRLNGGTGNDLLNGGLGSDTTNYSNIVIGGTTYIGATAGVTVNLNLSGAQNTGGAGIDTLVSMVNVIGTNFNDTLIGNSGDNVLTGRAGNDTLVGGLGNDRLEGSSGNDLLNGGVGNDTADYREATTGVVVSIVGGGGTPQDTRGSGIDTLLSIEHLIGSNFNDTLDLEGLDNSTLNGGAGNDRLVASFSVGFTLNGDAGDDWLECGTAHGTLNGGAGNDRLEAFDDFCVLNGGNGNDILWAPDTGILNGGAGADTLQAGGVGATYDYNAVSDSLAGVGRRDTITNFQGSGTAGNEEIDLRDIDGNQAFTWIGGGGFTAAGQLRYAGGVLSGNTDGDMAAEFEIQLVGAPSLFVQAGHSGSDILL